MTILTLQPDGASGIDTYIDSGSTTSNYGSSTELRTAGPAAIKKVLIKFDLSSIPPTAVINSATLSLTVSTAGGLENVAIHRGLVSFNEGNGNASAGSIAGSTWAKRDNSGGTVNWTGGSGGAAGTEYATSPTDTISISSTGVKNWNVKTDVENFVSGLQTNHGWWIVQGNGSDKVYRSSDYATGSDRPVLTIDYTYSNMEGNSVGTSVVSAEISYLDHRLKGNSSNSSTVNGTIFSVNEIVVFQPSSTGKDVNIRQLNVDSNFGSADNLSVGMSNAPTPSRRRTLIRFDISSLPANIHIVNATLSLYTLAVNVIGDTYVHRSLVEWFEGVGSNAGSTPGAGVNASTWNFRNHNGSVPWAGGAGGAAGSDWDATPTDTTYVEFALQFYDWDVTEDVSDFVSGDETNHGWWILTTEIDSEFSVKTFASSEVGVPTDRRPKLTVVYSSPNMAGTLTTFSIVEGSINGLATLEAISNGNSLVEGNLTSNEFMRGFSHGESVVELIPFATGYMEGNSDSDSSVITDSLLGVGSIGGNSLGQSIFVADIIGKYYLEGNSLGVSVLQALPNFQGQMRGQSDGNSFVSAIGYARAINVASIIGCYPTPLLYMTDGTFRNNGQLRMIDFLSRTNGYKLKTHRPGFSQYKDGGRWSSSPTSQGRRLNGKSFDNVIEVYELTAVSPSQDAMIEYIQDLIAFQEAASDFWVSKFVIHPFYMVRKAALEQNPQYAIIHMVSIPELENPYVQPFFDVKRSALETLTLRIERGHWLSTPPGKYECVPISSQRSWTVSGWQSGS